eukprot:5802350-Pleurochrysis_carterae.AAC.5
MSSAVCRECRRAAALSSQARPQPPRRREQDGHTALTVFAAITTFPQQEKRQPAPWQKSRTPSRASSRRTSQRPPSPQVTAGAMAATSSLARRSSGKEQRGRFAASRPFAAGCVPVQWICATVHWTVTSVRIDRTYGVCHT